MIVNNANVITGPSVLVMSADILLVLGVTAVRLSNYSQLTMLQPNSLRYGSEAVISSRRRRWMTVETELVNPVILISLIEPSIEVVTLSRL